MDERASFGQWLKGRRKALGLTQEELAERMACSGAMVRKIEAGERVASQEMAELLAEAFGIVVDERPAFVQFAKSQLSSAAVERLLWQTMHTVKAHPTNLAAPLTTLIGREQELERLTELLLSDSGRLFTLTGPPGIGKTRLSLEVGMELLDHFEDGVFFVSLAPVADPDLVLTTIARALGLPDKGAKSLLVDLQESLGSKHMLLMLDNFEQVLDASPFIVELLGGCPGLKVLATSREALHVNGEQQFHVPSLATADPENLPPIETLGSVPAITLFTERARAVKPDFALTEENAAAIAAICARLDGLPLAIELAAARIRLFSPQEMQSRLGSLDAKQNLPMLAGGPRNMPARQRTLRAALDWSYNLLNEWEQRLFARLGVFVGGATLPAIEAICSARSDLTFDVSAGIESLLDKNLLKRGVEVEGELRFSMLEMIREYAVERLAASGEAEDVRRLHAEYYLALAEAADLQLSGAEQQMWLYRLERDHDNSRAALGWALESGNGRLALQLVDVLGKFWDVRGYVSEGHDWLQRALHSAPADAPPGLLASAKYLASRFHFQQKGFPQAIPLAEEALALFRKTSDTPGIIRALNHLGWMRFFQGEAEIAVSIIGESIELSRHLEDPYQIARSLYSMGAAALWNGNVILAQKPLRESLAIGREIGNKELTGVCLNALGLTEHYQGRYASAQAYYDEAVGLARELHQPTNIAFALCNSGDLALHQGEDELARERIRESLKIFVEQDSKEGIAEGIAGLAGVAAHMGYPHRAARLIAASDALRQAIEVPLPPIARRERERLLAMVHSQLDEAIWRNAWREGEELTVEQAIAYALDEANINRNSYVAEAV